MTRIEYLARQGDRIAQAELERIEWRRTGISLAPGDCEDWCVDDDIGCYSGRGDGIGTGDTRGNGYGYGVLCGRLNGNGASEGGWENGDGGYD